MANRLFTNNSYYNLNSKLYKIASRHSRLMARAGKTTLICRAAFPDIQKDYSVPYSVWCDIAGNRHRSALAIKSGWSGCFSPVLAFAFHPDSANIINHESLKGGGNYEKD